MLKKILISSALLLSSLSSPVFADDDVADVTADLGYLCYLVSIGVSVPELTDVSVCNN